MEHPGSPGPACGQQSRPGLSGARCEGHLGRWSRCTGPLTRCPSPRWSGLSSAPVTLAVRGVLLADRDDRGGCPACIAAGQVASLEAEIFGGDGTEAAMAWRDGPCAQVQDRSDIAQWPFNRILRELGVTRSDAFDEFDAVRLRRQRFTTGWARMADRSMPQNAGFGTDPAISGMLQRADQNEPYIVGSGGRKSAGTSRSVIRLAAAVVAADRQWADSGDRRRPP